MFNIRLLERGEKYINLHENGSRLWRSTRPRLAHWVYLNRGCYFDREQFSKWLQIWAETTFCCWMRFIMLWSPGMNKQLVITCWTLPCVFGDKVSLFWNGAEMDTHWDAYFKFLRIAFYSKLNSVDIYIYIIYSVIIYLSALAKPSCDMFHPLALHTKCQACMMTNCTLNCFFNVVALL